MGSPAPKFLISAGLLALLATPMLQAAPGDGGSGRLFKLYCCEIEGQKTCGDTLPAQCQAKGYKELNGQGVSRQIGPPPTPEQRAQKEREEQRQKEAEAARKEQERKDTALLNTYSSEKDIDQQRTRNEQDLQSLIKQGEGRLAEAQKTLQQSKGELEFYKNHPVPPELHKKIKDAEYDQRVQKDQLERRRQELEQMRQKYDQDKRRYIELTRNKTANPAGLHPALVAPPGPPARQ